MRPRPENPLIVAIDVSDLGQAVVLAEALAPHVGMLKVGLELFWAHGPEAVRAIAERAPVFVDCKLHDIPTTVDRASANVAKLGVRMFNVHALGGEARVFVIGGTQLYASALPLADELLLTEVDADVAGDTLFPPFDRSQYEEVSREPHVSESGTPFAFVTYVRRA